MAGRSVQSAFGEAVRGGLVVEVGGQGCGGAGSAVGRASGVASGEEFDGRIAFDGVSLCQGLVGFAVDFGNENSWFGSERRGDLLPDGGQRFAICRAGQFVGEDSTMSSRLRPHHGAVNATRAS